MKARFWLYSSCSHVGSQRCIWYDRVRCLDWSAVGFSFDSFAANSAAACQAAATVLTLQHKYITQTLSLVYLNQTHRPDHIYVHKSAFHFTLPRNTRRLKYRLYAAYLWAYSFEVNCSPWPGQRFTEASHSARISVCSSSFLCFSFVGRRPCGFRFCAAFTHT